MANIKIVNEWLKEAEEDFTFASVSLAEHDRFFSRICFFFQQAAEKYFKAFIVTHNLLFEKIHDLPKLLKICQRKDSSFKNLTKEAQFLTDLYVDTRYPTFWPVGRTRQEAEKAKETAQRIGDFVKEKIRGKT